MIRKLSYSLSALLLSLSLLSFPTNVLASEGAIAGNDAYCVDEGDYRYCTKSHGVYNDAFTPSGSLIVISNGNVCISTNLISTGDLVREDCTRFVYHAVLKDDLVVVFQEGAMLHATSVFDTTTCTTDVKFQYANGQVRVENSSFGCI
jgi:hypothetical protein